MHSNKKVDDVTASPILDMNYVNRSLAIACTRGREAIVFRFRGLLRREDLSEQQWRVLRILFDLGALTSAEISVQACLHKVSISRLLKSLESKGLVSRNVSVSDARASYIDLTRYGRNYLEPLVEEAKAIHLQIARDFGWDRYEELLRLLKELSHLNDELASRIDHEAE